MFGESAQIYDLIYSFKDYKKEAGEIVSIIEGKFPDCKTILDIGCGTAEHHKYLKRFEVDGIDLNEEFISIAREKNIHASYNVADMTSFDLGKKYDVIICLFSSIGYLKTFNKIVLALKCFNRHLNYNGLLLLEPWFTPASYHSGKIYMRTYDENDVKICRMTHGYIENEFTVLNFHYMVATVDKGIRYFEERHELRLTSNEEMINALELAGFEVLWEDKGLTDRGMYYGRKKKVD